ncbi:MAG: MBL fold metallo-hydrolase [Planctomycetota bacterium JB042]
MRLASLVLSSLLAAGVARADDGAWTDLGAALPGANGPPVLKVQGFPVAGSPIRVELRRALAQTPAILVVGTQNASLPFGGGMLVPSPDVLSPPVLTSANGAIDLDAVFPAGVALGVDLHLQWWITDPTNPGGYAASNARKGTTADTPEPGTFPAQWIDGTQCASEPKIQVHAYNDDFYILRQSLCTHYEAPFLYLIFGDTKVMLEDTGAGSIGPTLASTVYGIIADWLVANGKTSIELVVVHSHAHGDHTAGDSAFQGQPNTTVVGKSVGAIQSYFGITSWPTQIVPFDLGGGRILDVIPIPGHHSQHVAFYDRRTATLLTGDSLYPGRLYVFGAQSQGNWPIYQASVKRLVDFTATRDLCWVLGTHVEMTNTPGIDFPLGAPTHPNERPLQLERKHLLELHLAIQAMGSTPVSEGHDDVSVYPTG